jgi:hypothetical protein
LRWSCWLFTLKPIPNVRIAIINNVNLFWCLFIKVSFGVINKNIFETDLDLPLNGLGFSGIELKTVRN